MSGGAKVAGIVISTIDHDSLVSMCGVDVLMTAVVDAGYHRSTTFAVHEVNCLPDTAAPCVIADSERAGLRVSGFDCIGARPAELGKVQSLIFAERSSCRFDRTCEYHLARFLIDEGKLAGC